MLIIHHRRNTPELVNETPNHFGIEIDIRSNNGDLIIHHDPFSPGLPIEDLLKYYNHKFLILNVKEEGLESKLIGLMSDFKINDFFFLDQSFPFLLKTSKCGESRCAARVSEYESVSTALALKGLVDWVWIDVFNGLKLTISEYMLLKESGFKLCLVSPELQGFAIDTVSRMQDTLIQNSMLFEAVCTKYPSLWSDFIPS